jgi:Protein of unknown function (DUF3102)
MITTIQQNTVEEINRLHEELQSLATDARDRAIRIGELLCNVKAKLGHGKLLSWLHRNVSFSERTARNYMGMFQERARLKSANLADLRHASLMLDSPSAKSKQQSAENSAHSRFLENLRNDLESPQSEYVEELKKVYRARLDDEGGLMKYLGLHCWTLEELQEDIELLEAFELIYTTFGTFGFDTTIRCLSSLNGLSREDLIFITSLGVAKMRDLYFMIFDKFWRKFSIGFLDEAPTKDSTIDEMQDRCLASKEKRVTAMIDGFLHICEWDELGRSWWKAAFYPGDLSKIPNRFSTIDELHATCMITREKCVWGYIGSFNYRCELMREGSKIHQSVFPASYETKLQEFICGGVLPSGDIEMIRV